MSDAAVADSPAPNDAAPAVAAGPTCSHCGAAAPKGGLTICPKCGFYPRLGTFFEPDVEEVDGPRPQTAETPLQEFLRQVRRIPAWVYFIVASVAAVAALSVVGRLVTPEGSTARMIWALVQLFLGCATFVGAHIVAYVRAAMEDDRLNVLDIFIRPIAVWMPTFRALPETLKRVIAGCDGLSAAILAVTIVGGIPYEKLWDWGFKERAKPNLAQALTDAVKDAAGDDKHDSLEDAVKGVSDAADDLKKKPKLTSVECVIIGYLPDPDDYFGALVLATVVDGKLKYVGTVSGPFNDETRRELVEKLKTIPERDDAIVPSDAAAKWVEPQLTCRVKSEDFAKLKRLQRAQFESILADLRPDK